MQSLRVDAGLLRLNWTKVGLKGVVEDDDGIEIPSLNWTKVGLKETND